MIGTSLLVMPVAGIPSWVRKDCPRVLLNRELVGQFAYPGLSDRDLYLEGDCDDAVLNLCGLAGWSQDLPLKIQEGRVPQKVTSGGSFTLELAQSRYSQVKVKTY